VRNASHGPPRRAARRGPARDRRWRRTGARRIRDSGAPRARLLERAGTHARATLATNGSNLRAETGSTCASGRDGHGEAGEAAWSPRSSRRRAPAARHASWFGPRSTTAARATRPERFPNATRPDRSTAQTAGLGITAGPMSEMANRQLGFVNAAASKTFPSIWRQDATNNMGPVAFELLGESLHQHHKSGTSKAIWLGAWASKSQRAR
jgi:hypothetical protein